MDWRVFLTTFGVIFLAEMGDKTQLAAMTMAAQSKKPWAVFIAAALALTAVSAIGVLAGSVLGTLNECMTDNIASCYFMSRFISYRSLEAARITEERSRYIHKLYTVITYSS